MMIFKAGKPGQGQVECGHFLRNRQVSFAADVLFKFIVSEHLVIILIDDYTYFDIPELITVLLIVMHELGCFEFVYIKSLMKSQNHETRSSMKLTGGATYMIKVQEIDKTRPILLFLSYLSSQH